MEETDITIEEEVRFEEAVTADETERRKRIFEEYQASPEYQAKLLKRVRINHRCFTDPESRKLIYGSFKNVQTVDQMVESCIEFIENFGFTFDPRPQANPHDLPFILFDFQKEGIKWMIEHIESGKDGLIEKSRDMGISWTVFVYVPVWYWLFRDGTNILLGSYKEALVDNKSKDSLFGMIDYAIMSLPKWMMPRGWNKDKHRTQMKIVNPMTWSQITGDTMNGDFGRGARKTVVLFDELGSWDYAKDAWEASGASTACRIGNSTPKGYNYFAMLREQEMGQIDVLRLHWKQHPLKDDQWYEYEKSRNSPETVAQELDISYNKSQTGRVYPEWNELTVSMDYLPYNPEWPLYVFWDFGNCVSSDTQALTKNGWKNHGDIVDGEFIYTMNQDTRLGEWQPLRGKYIKKDSVDAVSISGQSHSSLTTKNHKWFVVNSKTGSGEFKTSDEFSPNDTVQCSAELSTLPKEKVYTDSFVELVAWFWTEGQVSVGGVELYQAMPDKVPLIRRALTDEFGPELINTRNGSKRAVAGWKERSPRDRGGNYPLYQFSVNRNGATRFTDLVSGNKVLSYSFINKLTKEQLITFVEISILGDGWKTRGGGKALAQVVKERTEVFAYAAVLLGYRIGFNESKNLAGNDTFGVHLFNEKPFLHIHDLAFRRNGLTEVVYSGEVWCPTIDNKVWLARRNGTVYFTGNTDDTAIIWAQKNPQNGKLRIVDAYSSSGKVIGYFIPLITGIVTENGYLYSREEMMMIATHKNYRKATHFGDPAGRFKNSVVDQTVFSVLRDNNIVVNFKDSWKEFGQRKSALRTLINRGIELNENSRTKYLNTCMLNASYPKVKNSGMEQINSMKPKHDHTSHLRSAFEYGALGLKETSNSYRQVYDKYPQKTNSGRITRY